ncbi:BTAD domain-containing putative transcriptional regulator [Streptomyces sp. NPDC006368]|uniref:BTAD domain-containing putative transcriptional regulator n=1 Tax=Streptomyces sp. NPDC006368 TaxID=3156760 RepID=UPI0033A42D7B
MRLGVLGPVEVWGGDPTHTVRVPESKVRVLLAVLLAHRGNPVSSPRLVEALWDGAELTTRPTASLQAKVSQLRRVLEQAREGGRRSVARRGEGYLLDVEHGALDVDAFRDLVARGMAAVEPGRRAAALSDALGLWRGPAFAGFAGHPLVRAVAEGLEQERQGCAEELAAARLELGEHQVLVGELARMVAEHPLRERLRAVQMTALYRAGRGVEALESYAELRARLKEGLGLEPGPELRELHRAILHHDPALAAPGQPGRASAGITRRSGNVPLQVNSFVGREAATREVCALVRAHRLVTLTGPGGVGKTRLAIAAAAELDAEFPDGVWLVELAGTPVPDASAGPGPLAERILGALGVRQDRSCTEERVCDAVRQLADAVAARRMLLVLDNSEHLVDAAADLTVRLLDAAPELRVLTTGQVPLRICAEQVWPVPPLELPPRRLTDPAALREFSAVRLFSERAAAHDPGFVLDAVTAPLAASICRRVDGIPLAVELAAGQLPVLGLEELEARLDDRFQLLNRGYRDAPGRQRTLRAAIDWSWSLLEEQQRAVLRRLTVFREGCRLDAAEAVTAGEGLAPEEVLEALTELVDRSLVVHTPGPAGSRYRLPQSVAAYAQQRLEEAGESAACAARHLEHCTALAEEAQGRLHSRGRRHRLDLLDEEAGNFQRALEHARTTGAAGRALRLACALAWYRYLRGRLSEAHRTLTEALAVQGDAPEPLRAEARLWQRGFGLLLGGAASGEDGVDVAAATTRAPYAPLPRPPADAAGHAAPGVARAGWFLGMALWSTGDTAAATEQLHAVLPAFRFLRDTWGVAAALTMRAGIALTRGELAGARADAEEARARFGELGDDWGALRTGALLGTLAEIGGDYERAGRLHQQRLRDAQSLGMGTEISQALSGLGRIALLEGHFDQADELHAQALRLAVDQGHRPAQQFAALGLAMSARRQGRLIEVEETLGPWLAANRRDGDEPGLALVLAELGFAAEQRGDAARALELHREGLAAARRTGDVRAVALALEGLAAAHARCGRHRRAAVLLGAAGQARSAAGAPLPPAEQGDVSRVRALLDTAADPAGLSEAYAEGRRRPLDEVAGDEQAVAQDAAPVGCAAG